MVSALVIVGLLILICSMFTAEPLGLGFGLALLLAAGLIQIANKTNAAPSVTLTGKDGSAAS